MKWDRGKRSVRVHERPEEPPDAERDPSSLRASAHCGDESCPKVILTAATASELRAAEWQWRCPRCKKPDRCAAAEQRRWRG
jgi:hypothetical protein